jgi:hypothetical protein
MVTVTFGFPSEPVPLATLTWLASSGGLRVAPSAVVALTTSLYELTQAFS